MSTSDNTATPTAEQPSTEQPSAGQPGTTDQLAAEPARRPGSDGWWFWLRRGLSFGLLGLVVLLALAAVGVPAATGSPTYTIAGRSMEPTLRLGTLIVVQRVDPATIATGDIITFQLESGKPSVATHRVIGFSDSNGERGFVTKGDANEDEDGAVVQAAQVQGRLWYSVPFVGWVTSVFTGSVKAWLLPIAFVGLLGYGLWMLFTGFRARARR